MTFHRSLAMGLTSIALVTLSSRAGAEVDPPQFGLTSRTFLIPRTPAPAQQTRAAPSPRPPMPRPTGGVTAPARLGATPRAIAPAEPPRVVVPQTLHMHVEPQKPAWDVSKDDLARATVSPGSAAMNLGASGPHVVTLRLPNGKSAQAIFRPGAEGSSAVATPVGASYRHEVAASALSDALGFHVVPPTVEMTLNGEKGLVRVLTPGATIARAVPDRSRMSAAQGELVDVFHYISANTGDHDPGTYLVTDDGKRQQALLLDHRAAFPSDEPSPLMLSRPGELRPETRALLAKADRKEVARALVRSGLDDAAVTGVLTRMDRVQSGAHGFTSATPDAIRSWVLAAHGG